MTNTQNIIIIIIIIIIIVQLSVCAHVSNTLSSSNDETLH